MLVLGVPAGPGCSGWSTQSTVIYGRLHDRIIRHRVLEVRDQIVEGNPAISGDGLPTDPPSSLPFASTFLALCRTQIQSAPPSPLFLNL